MMHLDFNRRGVFEVLLAAEVLPVGVLNPALAHQLIGEVERVLQVMQSHHQANSDTGTALAFDVERAEALGSCLPINRAREFEQGVALIYKVDEFGSKQLMLALKFNRFRLHHFPRFRLPSMPFMTIQPSLSSSKR